jgi:hypothetical protein
MSENLGDFRSALARLPSGYSERGVDGRRWAATVTRSADGRRTWLFAEELGGNNVVSFNWYVLARDQGVLKPCEMSSSKVIEFVLAFSPATVASRE